MLAIHIHLEYNLASCLVRFVGASYRRRGIGVSSPDFGWRFPRLEISEFSDVLKT